MDFPVWILPWTLHGYFNPGYGRLKNRRGQYIVMCAAKLERCDGCLWAVWQQLAHKLGRSLDLKEDQQLLDPDNGMRRRHSVTRLQRDAIEPGRDDQGMVSNSLPITLSRLYSHSYTEKKVLLYQQNHLLE